MTPRPSSTSCWTSHEAGATFVYQGHLVRLLWQSLHESATSWRTWGLANFAAWVAGGFEWSRPYGTSWITSSTATPASSP